jgi:hypothetical protein
LGPHPSTSRQAVPPPPAPCLGRILYIPSFLPSGSYGQKSILYEREYCDGNQRLGRGERFRNQSHPHPKDIIVSFESFSDALGVFAPIGVLDVEEGREYERLVGEVLGTATHLLRTEGSFLINAASDGRFSRSSDGRLGHRDRPGLAS